MQKLHRDYTYTNIPAEIFPCVVCGNPKATISRTKVCCDCWRKLGDFAQHLLLRKAENERQRGV